MRKQLVRLAVFLGSILLPAIAIANEGFYIGILGGANILQNENHHRKHIVYKTGYAAGAFAGYGFCNNLRVEGEFFYRRNQIKHIKTRDGEFHRGHLRSYSLMANCLYDFDICRPVTPYIGIGLGADRDRKVADLPIDPIKKYYTRFAAQAIIGFSYPFCDYTEMSMDYRYHWGKSRQINNTFTLAVRFTF